MSRRLTGVIMGCIAVLCLVGLAYAATGTPPKDARKNTSLGNYCTAAEAYQMWKKDPAKIKVLDVRTVAEYVFVGHAPMARNIPSLDYAEKWDAAKKTYPLPVNPNFEAQVKKLFQPGDTILVMCRSGHRSAAAVDRLAKAGFTNVYNIVDGFEGDVEADKASPNVGKRTVDGWRNSSVPWTYDLDPALLYAPGN